MTQVQIAAIDEQLVQEAILWDDLSSALAVISAVVDLGNCRIASLYFDGPVKHAAWRLADDLARAKWLRNYADVSKHWIEADSATNAKPASSRSATVDVDLVTTSMIDAAVQESDLNEALYPLQRAAGIDAGDVAGVFFSGDDKNEVTWRTAHPQQRKSWLLEYLELERGMDAAEWMNDAGA
ncbi:hypothetical protein Tamer19_13320 [Cupriavidus sp. TA19]|uniref:hypothetical protein n=1 Tax=unclassified Cupriavidus TaxID=2640874 RepID=UPI00272945F3|nr:hypothetical protein [Cupriavidus sp. TA19]GLC91924.1 hypothetical protein Tamer19_13320 [Cupriavidus sp. TA19]